MDNFTFTFTFLERGQEYKDFELNAGKHFSYLIYDSFIRERNFDFWFSFPNM
jgi:hypothetical protein